MIAQDSKFSDADDVGKTQMVSPQRRCQIQVGWVKIGNFRQIIH